MVDSPVVAVLDGVQDLEEDSLGKLILANVLSALGDVVEEIAFGAILQNNIDAVGAVHDPEHGDHVGMFRCLVVESNLAPLESGLPAVQGGPIGVELAQTLHGILDPGVDIDGTINNSVGTGAQNLGQLELAFKNHSQPLLGG